MCPRTEIPAVQVGAIRRAMLAASNKSRFQRLQCLWLRAQQDLPTEAIAQTVGLSSHVRRVWSDYLRGGLAGAQGRPEGGRSHQNLTVAQERALLVPWQQKAQRGRLVTARGIKVRCESRVGRPVPDSTGYRLLARHQWRQVLPRPKHPRDNPQARAAFKKTSGQSYPKIQILAVVGLMNKTERVDAPPQANPFAKAQREGIREKQPDLV
jgi:transposase